MYNHEDLAYRQKMLVSISKLQLARGDVLVAARTAVAAKDADHLSWFISQFVEKGQDELAVQSAFVFQENVSQALISDLQYKL